MRQEGKTMAKIYVRKLREGTITIEDVPSRWRAEVEKLLEEEGDK